VSGRRRDPIGTLLRLRGIRERQARGQLAVAQQQLAAADDELAQRRQAYLDRPQPAASLTPAQLRVLTLQGVRTLELLNEAAEAYEAETRRERQAREAWITKTNELESAQRLSERREVDAAVWARKAADKALDELVLTLRENRAGRRHDGPERPPHGGRTP
jgi:flagellar biosynthesis chaperone FliJ